MESKNEEIIQQMHDQNESRGLLTDIMEARRQAIENATLIESLTEKLGKAASPDAHPPATVAYKAEAAGVTKGELNTLSTILLGILAGAFISLGAMLCTVVTTGSGLGFGINKLLGGLVFCLGLILVVMAGAELFTGNTLIVMSWMSGKTRLTRLLRNWALVYVANLVGALSLVGLMFYTQQWSFNGFGVGANALLIANAKVNLTFGSALARGILCNALVCLAVWLCFSARTIVDKIAAIIFPITAFVAAGFEHSIANMYFIPIGILMAKQPAVLEAARVTTVDVANLNWLGFIINLIPVTIGNIIGGSILIGAIYWLTYLRKERADDAVNAHPWVKRVMPYRGQNGSKSEGKVTEPVYAELKELVEKATLNKETSGGWNPDSRHYESTN